MYAEKIPNNEHSWLVEPFFEAETFIPKRMFGCLACYLHGKLMLVLADSEDPWSGVLVVTDRSQHPALQSSFPHLIAHPVLCKWLYIPAANEHFEKTVTDIVQRCLEDDARIGILPKEKKRKKKKLTRSAKQSR